MRRLFRLFSCVNKQQTANGMSVAIALLTMAFLHLESSPTPAGADIARRTTNRQAFVMVAAKPETNPQPQQSVTVAETTLSPEELTEQVLRAKIEIVQKGLDHLSNVPDYTAQFIKQELVNGDLLDEQEMEMKVRHEPFSVYLKWVTGEAGREVLYVEGTNDGRMTAHGGGWKARLPAVALDPGCKLAMAESRYPVTKVGLLELARLMVEVHQQDLVDKRVSRCERLPDQTFDGRPCHAFLTEYKDAKVSEQYRKSICLIDKEWSIPVYTRNFGWLSANVPTDPDEHDQASLIEFYSYSSIKFGSNLIAIDFDHTNEEYRFKRQ